MSIFKKKNRDDMPDGIVITSRTQPLTCGGTDAYIDTKAPKVITSEEMTLFDVTSAFRTLAIDGSDRLDYVSAFAAPCAGGSFVFLETRMLSTSLAANGRCLKVIYSRSSSRSSASMSSRRITAGIRRLTGCRRISAAAWI